MTVNKRSKNSRQRGSHTHGWGAKKKHRGAGNRGGRGNSGTGARADTRKPSVWNNPEYFGKKGFKKKNITIEHRTITIKTLEESAKRWEIAGTAKTSGETTSINLSEAGYTKLLGTGQATRTWKITIPYAVPQAVQKIKEAGGSVEGLTTPEDS
ncbi:uL15 family ribosomal protein [Candidatus Woesearchaeota archaeon]|nr:uL15 family ribosomal protein [Candidatus Woesearchaeota archaeon]